MFDVNMLHDGLNCKTFLFLAEIRNFIRRTTVGSISSQEIYFQQSRLNSHEMKAALDLICRFTSGIISFFRTASVGTKIMLVYREFSLGKPYFYTSPSLLIQLLFCWYHLQMKSYVETKGLGSFFGPLCIAEISWTFLGSGLPNLQISGSFEVG